MKHLLNSSGVGQETPVMCRHEDEGQEEEQCKEIEEVRKQDFIAMKR